MNIKLRGGGGHLSNKKLPAQRQGRLSSRTIHTLAIAAVFGLLGIFAIQGSLAATHVATLQAESGTVTGNATKVSDPNASGSQAVKFDTVAPVLPTLIKAVTGGTSIALVWNPSTSSDIKSYEIYRNGSKVATVTTGNGTVNMEKQARRYIDKTVSRGQTYRYQIKAVSASGKVSALSQIIQTTHPMNTTPTPTVSFEYVRAAAPSNRAAAEAAFKQELEIWYPKISDALAFPNYTPVTALIVETNPDLGYMGALGNRIGYIPTKMNDSSLPDMTGGTLIHEITHLVNAFGSGDYPAWLSEGMADWSRDSLSLDRPVMVPHPGFTAAELAKGYAPAASFISYIEKNYKASFPHDISIAAHNGTYTTGFIQAATGKTEAQLIEESRFRNTGATGAIIGLAGKCIDISNGDTTDGAKIQLLTCAGTNAQQWSIVFLDPTDKNPANGGTIVLTAYKLGVSKCLDVQSSGTASGTKVHYWSCNQGDAQQWKVSANNSLINPNSGKCLSTTGGGSADGTQLIIDDCNGSAGQRWTLP